jgi:GTPase SAR1 family protein
MKMIMFAGAGAVGKTSLMKACQELSEDRGIDAVSAYSTTRDTYAKYNLEKEGDALKDPDFNMKFQGEVMSDNMHAMEALVALHDNKNGDLVLADRTPYDYASYFFTVFQDRLNLDLIEDKRTRCDEAIVRLFRFVDEIQIVMLPFPVGWSKDTESSDGWRADKTGKNFIWSSVCEAELRSAENRLRIRLARTYQKKCKLTIARFIPLVENGPIEMRAMMALSMVYPDWV